MKFKQIRCEWCKRFISYDDLDKGLATCEYTPLSEFTRETYEWTCKRCNKLGE